ncbi:unnamed protein product [Adineta ricciae]|uniref:Uncharacterized protein n=1 Tax=Adineta ricciae TaxID=249248 RepID=A0A814W1H1_ADIRI|nr:unnamed protein product [Adineta ricciae]CAF1196124.1 unnamed protein product [Adineta ricciae]
MDDRKDEVLPLNAIRTSSREEMEDECSKDHDRIYWRLFFLSIVALWMYQTLVTAQNYFVKFYPTSHVEFWGVSVYGISVFLANILQLTGVYKYGFTKRVISGLIGCIVVGTFLICWSNPSILLIAFAITGGLNTLIESPIYAIGGFFPRKSFLQAIQVGVAIAGIANVIVDTIIRLVVLLIHSSIDHDQLAFYIFISVEILLCFVAMYVYHQLIRVPSVDIRIKQQMLAFQQEKTDTHARIKLNLIEDEHSYWALIKIVKIHLFVQFYTFFITLVLWPGVSCNVTTHGWFKYDGHLWWCSPFVVGAYNLGDLIGRICANNVNQYFSSKICLLSSLLRTIFVLIIVFRHSINNILFLIIVTLLGITNGLVATVSFMNCTKAITGINNYERAMYLMVTALYFGIACGSIFAAILTTTDFF